MAKGTETITVVRKVQVDRLKPVAGPEERFDIEDCIVWPRASQEEGGGWIQIDGKTVACPPDADVRAEDEVIHDGEQYSVIGTPGLFKSKRGKAKNLLVTLGKVS